MTELFTRAERARLAPFFPSGQGALLLSGLQGHMGRAFLSASGRSALVIVSGFVFLGGEPDEMFLRQAAGAGCFPAGFLTFSGREAWLDTAACVGAVGRMTRYAMATPARFDIQKLNALSVPPEGYTVLPVDDAERYALCLRAEGDIRDIVGNYPDASAFLRHALAFFVLKDSQVVAGCGTYAHADGWLEVEIDTHPMHRRRGLALCCGARFLLACQERGLRPHWDAMTEVSAALAAKLGFSTARPYPVAFRES